MLKLIVLAVCIGGTLLLAWLLYPDRIEPVFDELNGEPNEVNAGDVTIFLEAISTGFAVGFFILKWLFRKLGNAKAVRTVEADRLELQTVFVFITGLSFFMGSLALLEESVIQAMFHLIIGLACLLYLPIWYIRTRKKMRAYF